MTDTGLSHGVGPPPVTVIVELAVKPPSVVVTVIVALPWATPVTTPLELTVATVASLVLQLTLLSVALLGDTVAVNACVAPTATDALVGATVTPVTGTVDVLTVIADEAVKPPSAVVAVMVAVPLPWAVTIPLVLTVATVASLVLQLTLLLVALLGVTVAVRVPVPPGARDKLVGVTLTPVTATTRVETVTSLLAVKPPSDVVAVMVAVPSPCAVTTPLELTVATVASLVLQLTLLLVALLGVTVAESVPVSPVFSDKLVGATLTPVTAIVCPCGGALPTTNLPSAHKGIFSVVCKVLVNP